MAASDDSSVRADDYPLEPSSTGTPLISNIQGAPNARELEPLNDVNHASIDGIISTNPPLNSSPLADLGVEDFRSLVRLSTARMGCFDCNDPLPVSLPSHQFVDTLYTSAPTLIEGSDSFAQAAAFNSIDEALGNSLDVFFPPSLGYRDLFYQWHTRNLSRGSFEVSVLTEEGTTAVLQVVAYATIRLNHVQRIWFIIRDVTAQAKTVATLAHAEKHYRALVERPGLVLGRILLNETAEYFSPSLEEMIGVPIDQLKESPSTLMQFIHPEDLGKIQRLYTCRAASSLETIDTELRIRLKDGEYHAFYLRQSPMISQRGVVEFYDVIAIDIQRHKELEQELQRNAQVALVGQLAAGISHDFNNYLSAIVGQLDAALAQTSDESPISNALNAARKGAMSCANMASQLLNIGKGRSNSPRDVDLNEVVHEVCTLVSRVIPNKITLRVSTYPRPIYTQGERVQLQQVVINLLLNARDAMPNGGVLSVQVGSAAPSSNPNGSNEGVLVSGNRNAVAAFITVRDTGLGMSAESVRRIFTPFYTTKSRSGGTGLGLSMVKMIIEAHHGWLDVVSEEGEGSAFTVYLPLLKKEVEVKSATINPKLSPHPSIGLRSIAIAEDDDMIRNMLSTALSSMGCNVEVFSNGVLLLEYLQKGADTCDFIIIDDSMPKARGVELLESLRGHLPNADMILTSGDPSVAQDPALKRFGVKFLAKPFPLSELIALLQ